jgi:1-acyl-sn-glycerol-3-phosphate acyltransferase
MKAIVQTIRGGVASALWVMGAPFVTTWAAFTAQTRNSTCALVSAHFRRFLRRCRIEVVIDGDTPPKGQGAVICYNESSFADVAAFGMIMWDYIDRAAAADLYAYLPFGRRLARKAQIEMVPRGNRLGTEALMDRLIDKVRGGDRLAWGGEGHIVGIDGIGHFKRGACLIAIRAQVPIVPVTYYGGHKAMPFPTVRARPGTIRVRFGTPISTEGLTEDDARDLADKVQAIVSETYETLRAEAEVTS